MKYVYSFKEGNKDMRELLGGKGANLAEMTGIGLPVPRGFTVTTEACINYITNKNKRKRFLVFFLSFFIIFLILNLLIH